MPLDVRPLDVRCEHDIAALIAQQAILSIGVVLSQAAAEQILDERWSTGPVWTDAARQA
jgi:hypothetical protein